MCFFLFCITLHSRFFLFFFFLPSKLYNHIQTCSLTFVIFTLRFVAFDEPWKIMFNEPEKDKEWEDKWGLMDVNRELKPGVKIPDCGGQEVERRRKKKKAKAKKMK